MRLPQTSSMETLSNLDSRPGGVSINPEELQTQNLKILMKLYLLHFKPTLHKTTRKLKIKTHLKGFVKFIILLP